tara:strand:+ start:504 stop:677 length:174 start_codon:yes stop_codon:yes gene_type:complete
MSTPRALQAPRPGWFNTVLSETIDRDWDDLPDESLRDPEAVEAELLFRLERKQRRLS